MRIKLMSKMYYPTFNYSPMLSIGKIYEVDEKQNIFADRYAIRVEGRLAFVHKNDCETVEETLEETLEEFLKRKLPSKWKKYGIEHVSYYFTLTKKQALELEVGKSYNGHMLKDFEAEYHGNETYCTLTFVESEFEPYTQQDMVLDAMEYCLPYLSGCESPKIEPLGKRPEIKDIKYWNEARTQVPIDTTKAIQDGYLNAYDNMFSTKPLEKKVLKLDIPFRRNYMSFAGSTIFQENINEVLLGLKNYNIKGEKEMRVGLPYSVNFVEKHKRTTLVWKNFKITVNMSMSFQGKEDYETTKSEAHNEKFNHLYGFLMAYFKRVHQGKSKTQIKKYLNEVVYPLPKMSQLAFLQGVFYENCGVNYKEAKAYLQKIEKGESVNAETK